MSHPPTGHQHPGAPGQPTTPAQDWDAVPPPGQHPHGQPAYGPPQYGQSQYGQSQYGQPQYGHPQSGAPQYWPPHAAPPPNRTGLLWGLVAALGTVVLVLTVLLVVRPGPDLGPMPTRPTPVPAPVATLAPTGLGEDADLDRLAQQCSDGQMNPCDDLYDESFPGSDYEAYGDTCAGRRSAGQDTYCADVFYDS